MKKYILTIGLATSLLLWGGCTKDPVSKPTNTPASDVQISFINTVDDKEISTGGLNYKNAASNSYSVSLLKYYISNIQLNTKAGTSFKVDKHYLIDLASPAQNVFTLNSVPAGEYTGLSFYLGVDSLNNHTGAQDGFLDPSYGMFWTWNTGYIFFKHEGQFVNDSNQTKPLRLHFGADAFLSPVPVPLNFTTNGTAKKLEIRFNLNAAYSSAAIVDFNEDNNRQSTSSADLPWMTKMKQNFNSSFAGMVKE